VLKRQKRLKKQRRTAGVSGLAMLRTNFANGKYETYKLTLRKRRKPNPLHTMLGGFCKTVLNLNLPIKTIAARDVGWF
jgi:hypothetical protein